MNEKFFNIEKKIIVRMIHKRIILISSIVFIALAIFASAARVNIDQTRTIDLEKYYEIPLTEVKQGDVLNVEIQVTSGSAIDALVMKSSDYPGYLNAYKQKGTFNYIEEASMKGQTTLKYSYKFKEGGDYYLVLDNTDVPKGGAAPQNQVEMTLKVSVTTPATTGGSTGSSAESPSESPSGSPSGSSKASPKAPGFGFIGAILIMAALVVANKK